MMMKRSILLSIAFAGMTLLTLTSNSFGPAHFGNGDRTGRLAAGRTCGSVGCHGAPSANVTVSAAFFEKATGQPLTGGYVPGNIYEVHLKGVNTINNNTKFGFQVATVNASNTQAGSFNTVGMNPFYHVGASGGVQFLEHNQAITAGTPGNEYNVVFDWTAPSAGTGVVTLWAIFNGVDGNGNANAADVVSNPFTMTIHEHDDASVPSVAGELTIRVSPNPVTDYLDIRLGHGRPGTYTAAVYDLSGRNIYRETLQVHGSDAGLHIPAADWKPGMYIVRVSTQGAQWSVPFVRH